MKMGAKTGKEMEHIFKPVEKDRADNTAGKPYIYVFVVGVAQEHQGKGFGKILINTVIDKAKQEKIPLYLETETEGNVKMYEHFGFKLIKKVQLPILDLPLWELTYDPSYPPPLS